MLAGLEGYSTEMVAVCVLISIVAAFAYVYRKRVKTEYKTLLKPGQAPVVKEKPKKQINPQGSKNDYMQLLSGIVTTTRKKKWPLIAPAVIEKDGEYIQLVSLLVTPDKIIGVCAFGHGGTIVAGSGLQDWTQRVNDTEHKIPSPLKSINKAKKVMEQVIIDLDIQNRELEIIGGYTHPKVTLQGAAAKICYPTVELLVYLQMMPAVKEENAESKEILEKLRTVVLKPEKQKKSAVK